MFNLNLRMPLMALAMTAAVAACGGGSGGGGGEAAAPPAGSSATGGVPASAVQSVEGLIAFMNRVIDTMTNDTSEPFLLGDVVLPVDDTI